MLVFGFANIVVSQRRSIGTERSSRKGFDCYLLSLEDTPRQRNQRERSESKNGWNGYAAREAPKALSRMRAYYLRELRVTNIRETHQQFRLQCTDPRGPCA